MQRSHVSVLFPSMSGVALVRLRVLTVVMITGCCVRLTVILVCVVEWVVLSSYVGSRVWFLLMYVVTNGRMLRQWVWVSICLGAVTGSVTDLLLLDVRSRVSVWLTALLLDLVSIQGCCFVWLLYAEL